jgi:gallate decarboxylase subunit C
MTALSVRDAVTVVRERTPDSYYEHAELLSHKEVAADFAARFAGVPATSFARNEKVALYRTTESELPVLLGLYGDSDRVRSWLPGLPATASRSTVTELVSSSCAPQVSTTPACQQVVSNRQVDLGTLPVLRTTPRDAGPYLTMAMVYAQCPDSGQVALSVHRMLVLDETRLALWMVPGRRLRALYESVVRRNGRLPVTLNIGAPPAAMIASAVNASVLPSDVTKLDLAGGLAGAPITLASALSQPTSVLADSEIVLEGYLDASRADESLSGQLGACMPEFLGYDGHAQPELPVITVTAMTSQRSAMYQAVIGPGREQSVILGLAGALSVALSGDDQDWQLISDLHYSAAGGGMLLLVIAIRKRSTDHDGRLKHIARRVFDQHPFVKLVIFTDEDVDITSAEDVLWAVTTRSNLGADCTTFGGFRALGMDPSQGAEWADARGTEAGGGRTFIDATVPHRLRGKVVRSFPGAGS